MAAFPNILETASIAALHHLVKSCITPDMLALVTTHAATVIDCQPQPFVAAKKSIVHETAPTSKIQRTKLSPEQLLPSPPATPSVNDYQTSTAATTSSYQIDIPPLEEFIRYVVKRSNVQTGTLLASLVYTARLQRKLVAVAKGLACTCHRIFLATLIVTSKYLNDTSPKNKHWARYAVIFSVPEINLMEKQLLLLLEYNLRISQDELLQAVSELLPLPSPKAVHLREDDDELTDYIQHYMVDHSPPLSEYTVSHSNRLRNKRQMLHDSAYSSDNYSPISSHRNSYPITLHSMGDQLEHGHQR
ncbi:hypothetical protein K450DRAFT_256707 [Umbelopsis ramanniana AG]|uniref:Cyclin N-terminal domain-containing protein n=1 Tax=Umbelopsis ramanniana AG TaxID=1314678 RepID=A0AAD5HA49_UMBRA|nr:uncharacterized protein K450DRAFT_256707 [Umbelopsis ramanniana AG]KAI8576542.1 hypothetical protein K450DRAFT_256707 [Umbelopsis ramanniana AG]